MSDQQPFIAAEQSLPEMTFRVIILAVILSAVLAMANAYLALKIGILTSASIPAAIISMGILRFFKDANILENNLVQTAASAAEAVAGGVVYTVPALILIHYWFHFPYWETCFIALMGGILGVFFSVPLRRVLVNDKHLRFPEGRAIAEVLKIASDTRVEISTMMWGGLVGALIEFGQTGLKIIASSWEVWFSSSRAVYGFGAGFSATMIGAGYLIGFDLGLSIFLGAVISWFLSVPALVQFFPVYMQSQDATSIVMQLFHEKIRYMGIGAMLLASVWTMLSLAKPFIASLRLAMRAMNENHGDTLLPRTDRDIPLLIIFLGLVICAGLLFIYFSFKLPVAGLPMSSDWHLIFYCAAVAYVIVIGFVCSAITAYFSGMVGVTASPGSAIIIASILLAALGLTAVLSGAADVLNFQQLTQASAITILFGAVITGAAAISNDNIQDLKVGHILGATPWKQQVMLLLGVVVSCLVIPPVMELLFNVYGIGDVMPRAGMDPRLALAAPPAALMAGITQAVFYHNMPWDMLGIGAMIIATMILIIFVFKNTRLKLSILGIAIGMYLPLASSTPIFLGALIAVLTRHSKPRINPEDEIMYHHSHRGTLLACGLVAGSALMDVLMAIPFAMYHSPDALSMVTPQWLPFASTLGATTVFALGYWFYRINQLDD